MGGERERKEKVGAVSEREKGKSAPPTHGALSKKRGRQRTVYPRRLVADNKRKRAPIVKGGTKTKKKSTPPGYFNRGGRSYKRAESGPDIGREGKEESQGSNTTPSRKRKRTGPRSGRINNVRKKRETNKKNRKEEQICLLP